MQTAQAQIAYDVERDGVMQHIDRADPQQEHPYQWQARYYHPGKPKNGVAWGEIIGQSADDVTEELQRSQQLQLRLAKFCKCDSQDGSEDQALAYSNVLGPLAVYEKSTDARKTSGSVSWQRAMYDLADRLEELEKDFLAVTEEKRVQKNPERYPFAPSSAPWNFAKKLAQTKRQFEQLNAAATSADDAPSPELIANQSKLKDSLTDLESNLLQPMRKSLATTNLEGAWKHKGMSYVAAQSGNQLKLASDDPDALQFRNIVMDGANLNGEIQFIYDNGCDPIWAPFTAELTFDTDMEGILISVPRIGREKSTCKQITQGTLRMMFWRPEE